MNESNSSLSMSACVIFLFSLVVSLNIYALFAASMNERDFFLSRIRRHPFSDNEEACFSLPLSPCAAQAKCDDFTRAVQLIAEICIIVYCTRTCKMLQKK